MRKKFLLLIVLLCSVLFIIKFIYLRPKSSNSPGNVENYLSSKVTKKTVSILPIQSKQLPQNIKAKSYEIPIKESRDDELQIEEKQISAAMIRINGTENNERIEGIELLGVYPNAESEMILSQLLENDSDSDVRNNAALSLGYLDEPLDSTIYVLMNALHDKSKDVRLSAFYTLQNYMLGFEVDSNNYENIHLQLLAKLENNELQQDVNDAIKESLESE